jgi:GR25 family glycosyltransferase involved in LPS biosynthesis
MHILNSEFDRVICINLVNRPDKKEYMSKKFDQLGIEVDWFNAVPYGFAADVVNSLPPKQNSQFPRFNKNAPNEFGAAMSHYSVIKESLLKGHDKIFVFEDDVMFIKDFNKRFESYYKNLPEDWDMFLLYSFMYKIQQQNTRINSRWIRSYDSWSLMSYGMNKNAMEKYIKEQDEYFRIADLTSFDMQRQDLNIYSAVPTLTVPKQELGSNIRTNMNYIENKTVLNLGFSEDNYE